MPKHTHSRSYAACFIRHDIINQRQFFGITFLLKDISTCSLEEPEVELLTFYVTFLCSCLCRKLLKVCWGFFQFFKVQLSHLLLVCFFRCHGMCKYIMCGETVTDHKGHLLN